MQWPQVWIITSDRGFVYAAEVEPSSEPGLAFHWHCIAQVTIRKWGTTKGIGELVDGPTSNTITDKVVEAWLPHRSVLNCMVCSEKGVREWKKVLKVLSK